MTKAAYAREVCGTKFDSRIFKAFERVPRERFLGRGPWYVYQHVPQFPYFDYVRTRDAKAENLYHDVSVALDTDAYVNTGLPSAIAQWVSALELQEGDRVLQIGAGTGYYSAILAELVGRVGAVVAVEVRRDFAEKARRSLSSWPQVEVIVADGAEIDPGAVDAVIVHAGVTDIAERWLDRVKIGGALVVPLTLIDPRFPGIGFGPAFRVQRRTERLYAASFLSLPYITTSTSLRDTADSEIELRGALETGRWEQVRQLRRDQHEKDTSCWLHRERWCLSTDDQALGQSMS